MDNAPCQDNDECSSLKQKPSHTKPKEIDAMIISKFNMVGCMFILILWRTYSSRLISFAFPPNISSTFEQMSKQIITPS